MHLNNQVAQFKFEDKFHITGRGLVITGQIIDGEISPGSSIYIEHIDGDKTIKILGVEHGHKYRYNFVGLLINIETTFPESELEKLLGHVFNIIR